MSEFMISEKYCAFLSDLFSPNSRLIGKPEDNHGRIFIMASEKSYWLYRIVREKIFKDNMGVNVYSGRYLKSLCSTSFVTNQEIVLCDDELSDGNRMFEYYVLLKKLEMEGNKPFQIIPVVFCMDTRYPAEEQNKKRKYDIYLSVFKKEPSESTWGEFEGILNRFNESLRFSLRTGTQVSADFALEQTWAFQKSLAPLAMELPLIRGLDVPSTQTNRKVLLTGEQFRILTHGNHEWVFTPISYHDMEKVPVTVGYFQLQDEELINRCSGMIHDLTVVCRYNTLPDGNYEAVFIPFALIRSMAMPDVHRVFCMLFRDTEYYQHINNVFRQKINSCIRNAPDTDMSSLPGNAVFDVLNKNRELCCAEYQSIVFSISDYVSCRFKDYAESMININIIDDMSIMPENFERPFVNTVKKKHEEYAASKENYERLYRSTLWNIGNVVHIGTAAIDSKKDAYYKILGNPNEKQAEQLAMEAIDQHKQMRDGAEYSIPFEELERMLGEGFRFKSRIDSRRVLTGLIVKYLEISIIGNAVSVLEDTGIVRHVFYPETNADIYCRKEILYMYAYLYGGYAGCADGRLDNNLEYLMDKMETYFIHKNYFGFLIEKDDFLYYKNYFINRRNDGSLGDCILSKSYLLDSYFSSEPEGRDQYIGEGMRNAIEWLNT